MLWARGTLWALGTLWELVMEDLLENLFVELIQTWPLMFNSHVCFKCALGSKIEREKVHKKFCANLYLDKRNLGWSRSLLETYLQQRQICCWHSNQECNSRLIGRRFSMGGWSWLVDSWEISLASDRSCTGSHWSSCSFVHLKREEKHWNPKLKLRNSQNLMILSQEILD